MPQQDGHVMCNINFDDSVTLTPQEATPDANNNIVITLVDDSNGMGWVFADDPITIRNDADFTVTRNANGQITVNDNENDSRGRGNNPMTHKYTLHFVSTTHSGQTKDYDPTIKDRVRS